MELLRFSDLARHYGANDVFTGLSGVVRDGDKIALVGPNGAGKSSLVRILVGQDQPDAGSLSRTRDLRCGYLAQDAAESGPQTLGAAFEEALARGQAHEWEMRATLNRFGFAETDLDRPLAEFSGGQRTRALLARTLLESPDWLMLDEPTNHLDLDTVRWLENFVAGDSRAYLIVSHDRYFLETVATQIWRAGPGRAHRLRRQAGARVHRFPRAARDPARTATARLRSGPERTQAAARRDRRAQNSRVAQLQSRAQSRKGVRSGRRGRSTAQRAAGDRRRAGFGAAGNQRHGHRSERLEQGVRRAVVRQRRRIFRPRRPGRDRRPQRSRQDDVSAHHRRGAARRCRQRALRYRTDHRRVLAKLRRRPSRR